MEGELKAQEKELSDDINNLNKKVSPTPFLAFHSLLTLIYLPVKIPRETV